MFYTACAGWRICLVNNYPYEVLCTNSTSFQLKDISTGIACATDDVKGMYETGAGATMEVDCR